MTIESFIATYGYLAVLIGVLIEGEVVVITAGILAYRQILQLDGVIAVAVLGSILTYQIFFLVGRTQGTRVLARRPRWQARVSRAQRLLERHHTWLTLSYRALFGLRMITPFALGMTRISHWRFLALDVLPALAWGFGFGCLGYYLGQELEPLIARILELESWALSAVTGAALLALAAGFAARRCARG
ncbi:MAG: DedA family protein [Gammaproteobacteria bacterium]|nr:DedA family protein [Gammaproteobacteria bacterium]